jgi:hypothetical protein
MNENMRRHEQKQIKPIVIHPALRRPWSEHDLEGLRALNDFIHRLRFTQKKNYEQSRQIFVARGICRDQEDFEALMMALDNSQHREC